MKALIIIAFVVAIMFPPFIRHHPAASERVVNSGWAFIGEFWPNDSIRWEILGVELAALGVVAFAVRKPKAGK